MIDCPRCLGKGHVDYKDIIRLKRAYFWTIGPICAFCNGQKKVAFSFAQRFNADDWFITTDLPAEDLERYVSGDKMLIEEINKQERLISFTGNFIMDYHFSKGFDQETVLKLISYELNTEIDQIREFVSEMFEQIQKHISNN